MVEQLGSAQLKDYLDQEEGLGRVRGNQNLFNRMLGLFMKSEEFDKLEKAMEAQDYAAASDVAHAIKGLCGNLSMHKLFELSNQMMIELKDGQYNDDLYRQYQEALGITRDLVQKLTS